MGERPEVIEFKRKSASRIEPENGLDFSVVVCTYNRSKTLTRCLQNLVAVDYPPSRHEVIVIDNNSIDETCRVVAGFPSIKYFFEGAQGLSPARDKGWREARGRYVAFVDDELIVPADWLRTRRGSFAISRPRFLAAPIKPGFRTESPIGSRRPIRVASSWAVRRGRCMPVNISAAPTCLFAGTSSVSSAVLMRASG